MTTIDGLRDFSPAKRVFILKKTLTVFAFSLTSAHRFVCPCNVRITTIIGDYIYFRTNGRIEINIHFTVFARTFFLYICIAGETNCFSCVQPIPDCLLTPPWSLYDIMSPDFHRKKKSIVSYLLSIL